MNAYLPGMESERRNAALSQWFTHPKLATKVWAWANKHRRPTSVLEPAAGQGALIKPIFAKPLACTHVAAIDIDSSNTGILDILARRVELPTMVQVVCADFLATEFARPLGIERFARFDLALMNPPYEDGLAEEFILHALSVSERVVGIFKASVLHGAERHRSLWSKCHTLREARLMSRPSFGVGKSGSDQALTDFVVLEIVAGATPSERCVLTENWP